MDRIREEADDIASKAGPHLTCISLRLRLEGSTPISRGVPEVARRVTEDLDLRAGSASVGVEKIDVETTPPIDLEAHAGTRSAPGAVARLLLELSRPEISEDVAGLIRKARSELERVERQKDFTQLKPREVTDREACDHLQTQARALLTQLLSQNS